jgi:hypothetical protein
MEGGLGLMRRLSLMIPCVVAFALIVCLVGPAHAQEEGTGTKVYRMKGKLEAIDLTERWVTIRGLRWDLADDFQTDDFALPKWGRIEYGRPIRIIFFVRCAQETLSNEKAGQSEEIEHISRLDLMKEINERGCVVSTIERAPM